VDELPLVVGGAMRSPFNLAALTPEAKNLGGDNGFILGGGQAAAYGTTLDGVTANTTRALSQSWVGVNSPSIEAVTEFTVDNAGVAYPIYNPTTQVNNSDGTVTRTVFPGNIVPKNLFDPTVVKALAAFKLGPTPLPNTGAPPGTFGYVINNYLITNGTEIRPN